MTTPYERLATFINTAAAKGQVVDVTNITAEGTGVRAIAPPKTAKSTRKGIEGLPIVSANLDAYTRATNILGAPYTPYAQQYAQQFPTQLTAAPPAVIPITQPTMPFVPTITQPTVPFVPTITGAPIAPAMNPQLRLATAIETARKQGKVIDVSTINPDATGVRTIKIPKTATGTKKWIGDFPVVSNNYATYLQAMTLLGQEYLPLAQHYLATHGGAKIVRTPRTIAAAAKSPGRFGPKIEAFPTTANMPPLITIPTAGTTTRTTVIRQPAIVQTGNVPMVPTVVRPVSPPRVPFGATISTIGQPNLPIIPGFQTTRLASPPRVPTIPGFQQTRLASPPRVPTVPIGTPSSPLPSPILQLPVGIPIGPTYYPQDLQRLQARQTNVQPLQPPTGRPLSPPRSPTNIQPIQYQLPTGRPLSPPRLQVAPIVPLTTPPRSPIAPASPRLPTVPVSPRLPTVPASPRLPTVPVSPRLPTVPIVPVGTPPRTPTIRVATPQRSPALPTIPTMSFPSPTVFQ